MAASWARVRCCIRDKPRPLRGLSVFVCWFADKQSAIDEAAALQCIPKILESDPEAFGVKFASFSGLANFW